MSQPTHSRNFAAAESVLEASQPRVPQANHQQTLLAILAAVKAGDYASLHGLVTDDVALHIHGFPEIDGTWNGRDQVVAAMETNFGKVTEQTSHIDGIVTQDDSVVVRLRETGRMTASGEPYSVHGIVWYSFEAGRLKFVEELLTLNG